jgi:hypothetical protein
MSGDIEDLGLSAGDSFYFLVTYLNATNAFRADEAVGVALPEGNPGTDTVNVPDGHFVRFDSVEP